MKLAFLGCDSTHTEQFAKAILRRNETKPAVSRISLWGENPEQAAAKAASFPILSPCSTPERALEGADLALVIGRFADSHARPARLALERRIPVFVDKPFVPTAREADELLALSRKSGTPLCSSSPLRFCREIRELKEFRKTHPPRHAEFFGPATCIDLQGDARFDSTLFYGIHAAEMLVEVLGHEVREVSLRDTAGFVEAELRYPGFSASLKLVKGIEEHYSFAYFGEKDFRVSPIALDASYYGNELAFLLEEFLPGKSTIAPEGTRFAISLLERMENARRKK